ncbi:hypothetical protein, partial [Acinetobacter sp. CFCC 10889]|uniref:hypothetical protein n=1 Tax=Acinetobacter sp. CFCC 10889 TaxID=1775557 RepID=UPI0013A698C3
NEKIVFVHGYSEQLSKFIRIGSLVYWKCDTIITEKNFNNIQGIGYVSATAKPEFNNKNQKWSVEYDLFNTKEAI